MINFKKYYSSKTTVIQNPFTRECYVDDNGCHHVRYVRACDTPIIENDGGMTPHNLVNNPSLMVTGTQVDITPTETLEHNIDFLMEKANSVESVSE